MTDLQVSKIKHKRDVDAELPARSDILAALQDAGVPVPLPELAARLGVRRRQTEAFAERIAALVRLGDVLHNRKGEVCLTAKLDLVTGTVQGHADGFGFLIPDAGGADVYLSAREMH